MKIIERFTVSIDDVPESDYLSLTTEPTEEEKKSYAYEIWKKGPVELRPEQEAALLKPMDPSRAFMPEDMAMHMMGPNVDLFLGGYCILPNGIGFGATWCDMSDITDEMEAYFDDNTPNDGDMFYKAWYPGQHVRHYANAAIEAVGREPEILRVSRAPEWTKMGFPENVKEVDPNFLNIRGGNSQIMKITDREGKEHLDVTLLHFYRKMGKGKFICSRFWMGLNINRETGKSDISLPFFGAVREDVARGMARHCFTEYATNARNIRDFWNARPNR